MGGDARGPRPTRYLVIMALCGACEGKAGPTSSELPVPFTPRSSARTASTESVASTSNDGSVSPAPSTSTNTFHLTYRRAEVETFLRQLQAAVQADNRDGVAALVDFPLAVYTVDGTGERLDRNAFHARYDQVFNSCVKAAIASASTDTLFENYKGLRIRREGADTAGRDIVWFDHMAQAGYRVLSIMNSCNPP